MWYLEIQFIHTLQERFRILRCSQKHTPLNTFMIIVLNKLHKLSMRVLELTEDSMRQNYPSFSERKARFKNRRNDLINKWRKLQTFDAVWSYDPLIFIYLFPEGGGGQKLLLVALE